MKRNSTLTVARWLLPVLLIAAITAAFSATRIRGTIVCDGLTLTSGATISSPTLTATTSVTSPLVIGGTAASSTLTLESTSGTGTTDAIVFATGAQAEAGRITTGGVWVFGTGEAGTTPTATILRAPSGAGTNITGANVQINGGISTGTGLGGSVVFGVANKRGTGTTANAIGNVFTIAPPNTGTTAPVNGLTLTSAITSGTVSLTATGTDATIPLTIAAKSTANLSLNTLIVNSSGAVTTGTWAAGQLASSGLITSSSPTAGIGYATGAGGTITQMTNKSTGVTLNTVCGTITMNNASLAADTTVAFTLTDSAIAANDVVVVVHDSVGTLGAYSFGVTPGAGSAVISVHNNTPGALGEAIVLRFVVIKAVVS